MHPHIGRIRADYRVNKNRRGIALLNNNRGTLNF
jgi:hypothetical protein